MGPGARARVPRMVFYLLRRLAWAVVVLLAVTLVTFVIFYKLPSGDPALRFVGKQPTPESIAMVRHNLGLDKPFYVQYAKFLKAIVTGDKYGWPGLGYSYDSSVPIREKIMEKAPRTISLIVGASILWLDLRHPHRRHLGDQAAHGIFDRVAMGFALFGISAPVFWLGLMALFLVWYKLGLTAGTGYTPFTRESGAMGLASDTPLDRARHAVRGDLRAHGARQPARCHG